MSVHSEHPFAIPLEQRDPVRRLRGRLAAPVTVITSSGEFSSVGMTVSSFFVVEGPEPRAAALVGPGADLLSAAEHSQAFVAHILTEDYQGIADVFAGLRPAPGGKFANVETEDTDWGPRLVGVSDWAGCRLDEVRPLGDQHLLIGVIEELGVSEMRDPLVYFRGGYRRLRS